MRPALLTHVVGFATILIAADPVFIRHLCGCPGDLQDNDPLSRTDSTDHLIVSRDNTTDTILDGLTITAGRAETSGGTIRILADSSPRLINLHIHDNFHSRRTLHGYR